MKLCLCALHLILDTIMSVELINYQSVVELVCEVGMLKKLKAEYGQGRFESEVNKGKLSLRVPNCVAVYTKNEL